MSEILKSALRYAKFGFSVVRLCPNEKRPHGVGWQDRATDDPGVVRRWKGDWNVGVLGGSAVPNGRRLMVLDVDVREKVDGRESLRQLEEAHGSLPPTANAWTANGGGKHFYYSVPRDFPLVGIRGKLAASYPGLDLIGDGLFAVAPPSRLGRLTYDWNVYPEEILSEAPEWLLSLVRPGVPPGPLVAKGTQRKALRKPAVAVAADELLANVVQRYRVEVSGQRNDRMHRAVASLFARGLPDEVVRTVMLRWHSHFASVIGTPLNEAAYFLEGCIASTRRKVTAGLFEVASVINHTEICAEQNLSEAEFAALDRLLPRPLASSVVSSLTKKSKGGQKGSSRAPRLRSLTHLESAFVVCLLLHARYDRQRHGNPGDGVFGATNQQLISLIRKKFGEIILADGKQVRRLRDKFITGKGRKAEITELAVLVAQGPRGRPSIYRLSLLNNLATATDPRVVPANT